MSFAAGARLGPYEILSLIGSGGMGEVYRALDTRLDRDVAVKILPARGAGDPVVLERFNRDARVIAPVSSSREIPTASAQRSGAVPPFRNLSVEAENAFFSDGITEDLIDALGRIPGLKVASRASAFRFRDPAQNLQEVGAALVDAQTGFQIWSDRMGIWLLAIALDHQDRLEDAEAMIAKTTAMSRAPIFVAMVGKIYARQGRASDSVLIEAELENRRLRGESIPRACDVIITAGRSDVPALRRALQACVAEQTCRLTVRMGPGPSLETFRSDPEVDVLMNQIYDGARPAA